MACRPQLDILDTLSFYGSGETTISVNTQARPWPGVSGLDQGRRGPPSAGVRARGRWGLSTRRAVRERRRDQCRSLITVYTSPIICVICAIKTFPTVHSLTRGTKGTVLLLTFRNDNKTRE